MGLFGSQRSFGCAQDDVMVVILIGAWMHFIKATQEQLLSAAEGSL